ncbi:hypothetical protein HY450_03215 [Candidatus Pacearchaeota archaeon]|nr:hypothetical protein [Candidatus Pacearchaeota archaeon]
MIEQNKQAKVNIFCWAILGLVVLILFAYFVIGAHIVKNSVNGAAGFGMAQSDTANSILNITVNNTNLGPGGLNESSNITQINITLPIGLFFVNSTNDSVVATAGAVVKFTYLNFTSGNVLTFINETILLNGSNNITTSTNVGQFVFNVSANGSAVGVFNISVIVMNGSLGTSQHNLTIKINDTTTPVIEFNNGSTTGPFANTSSIFINVTVTEVNEQNRSFIINGTSGIVNKTVLTDRTVAVNFTQTNLSDGWYNISVLVSDKGPSNLNTPNTASSPQRVVILDRTAPVVTFTCTPALVSVGDTVTCSCSGTDATSGVKTTTYTVNPSTSDTGTFSPSCGVTDYTGNSASKTASYTVELGSSSGGGGSSGGSGGDSSSTPSTGTGTTPEVEEVEWSQTYQQNDEDFSVKSSVSQELASLERVTILLSDEEHFVGVKSLTESSVIIQVGSVVEEATLNVGESEKFDLTQDGYYDVKITLVSITDGKANLIMDSINEKVIAEETPVTPSGTSAGEGLSSTMWIVILVVIIVAILIVFFVLKRKE